MTTAISDVIKVPAMEGKASNLFETGFHALSIIKEKPKVLNTGIDCCTRRMKIPAITAITNNAAPLEKSLNPGSKCVPEATQNRLFHERNFMRLTGYIAGFRQ